VDVKAAFLTEGRGTVDSKDRNLWQGGVVKDIRIVQRVVDLSQLDFEGGRALVHVKVDANDRVPKSEIQSPSK
jgi:hypothetical protein